MQTVDRSIKVVVVGDGAVGKTSLLMLYINGEFPNDYIPTIFDNYTCYINIGNERIHLGLWDTAGQEEYDQIRPLSYPSANAIILMFSCISPPSFHNIKSKWIIELQHFCPDLPIVLVASKIDLREDVSIIERLKSKSMNIVTNEMGIQLAKEINAVKYLECSALRNLNVRLVFDEAIRAALGQKSLKHKSKRCLLL